MTIITTSRAGCTVRRQGQEAKVRAVHPAGRMGDRGHAAGARHEGDRRARGQGADGGADVAAAFGARFLPGRTFRAEEHHLRDRHQAGVLAFALDGRRHARRRLAEQSGLQAVDRRKWRCREQRK